MLSYMKLQIMPLSMPWLSNAANSVTSSKHVMFFDGFSWLLENLDVVLSFFRYWQSASTWSGKSDTSWSIGSSSFALVRGVAETNTASPVEWLLHLFGKCQTSQFIIITVSIYYSANQVIILHWIAWLFLWRFFGNFFFAISLIC